MDHLTREARSANMKAIGQKDTAPEMLVRRLLFSEGYRYRLHVRSLPGSPDIVFTGRRKAIFVHGCFWHGHECRIGHSPQSRQDYWLPKISRNRERDAAALDALSRSGWAPLIIWECETKHQDALMARVTKFLGRPRRTLKG